MDVHLLKKTILSLTEDIEFRYKGVHGSIVPLSANDIEVTLGDKYKQYTDIDVLMNDPFLNGRALIDIAQEIEIL